MKKALLLIILVFVGTAGWRIGNHLSSDAISMAVGVFFGVLAGLPTALLVLAADRRKTDHHARNAVYAQHGPAQSAHSAHMAPHQPPVIILNGPAHGTTRGEQRGQMTYLPDSGGFDVGGWPAGEWPTADRVPRPSRRFKVVGEQEEWIE